MQIRAIRPRRLSLGYVQRPGSSNDLNLRSPGIGRLVGKYRPSQVTECPHFETLFFMKVDKTGCYKKLMPLKHTGRRHVL